MTTQSSCAARQELPSPSSLHDVGHAAMEDPALSNPARGVVGLTNLGNTCFMNSIIQCLSFTRLFSGYILRGQHKAELARRSELGGELIEAYAELIATLWSATSPRSIAPRRFKGQVGSLAPRFVGYAQHDAQEFLRFLLDGLHSELNRVSEPPKYAPHPPEVDRLPLPERLAYHEKWYRSRDDSAVLDIFGGLLRSSLRCERCSYCSHAWDPFLDISLEIPRGAQSLSDLLANFTKQERLDGDERPACERCKHREGSTKTIAFEKLPEVLVIHLKRFSFQSYYGSKISTRIRFPLEGLSLQRFCTDPSNAHHYRLVGMSIHSGTSFAGHYTAMCRHPANSARWLHFNDSSAHPTTVSRVQESEAYVLFYERTRQ